MSTSQRPQTVYLSNMAEVPRERAEAIASAMAELMAMADGLGETDIVANALIGAFVNYSLKRKLFDTAKLMLSTASNVLAVVEASHSRPDISARARPQDSSGRAVEAGEPVVTEAEVRALARRINEVLQTAPHDVGLSALVSLVRDGAMRFDCCTESVGQQCVQIGRELLGIAASAGRGGGTTVH